MFQPWAAILKVAHTSARESYQFELAADSLRLMKAGALRWIRPWPAARFYADSATTRNVPGVASMQSSRMLLIPAWALGSARMAATSSDLRHGPNE